MIDEFKRRILEENLTEPGKQDITYFKRASEQIQHLANILHNLVDKKDDYNKTTSDIRIAFNKRGIDFSKLTDEEYKLFKYYITNDMGTAGYSLLPK